MPISPRLEELLSEAQELAEGVVGCEPGPWWYYVNERKGKVISYTVWSELTGRRIATVRCDLRAGGVGEAALISAAPTMADMLRKLVQAVRAELQARRAGM